jgi:hypothetical protein
MTRSQRGLSDRMRFLLAVAAGLLFSLTCLAAALEPTTATCERLRAFDCPTRL